MVWDTILDTDEYEIVAHLERQYEFNQRLVHNGELLSNKRKRASQESIPTPVSMILLLWKLAKVAADSEYDPLIMGIFMGDLWT